MALPQVSAQDPDGDSVTFSLGPEQDELPFTMDTSGGQLSLDGTLDRETTASYSVVITATDSGIQCSVYCCIKTYHIEVGTGGQLSQVFFRCS